MAALETSPAKKNIIALFDVDGTLTPARKEVDPKMVAFLAELRTEITIGFVGGSDLKKQQEQLGPDVLGMFDYCFSENGLTAFKDGELIGQQSFSKYLGEETLTRVLNWTLHYLSTIKIPVKRGTFIEFRAGMLNISPIGRNCSQQERDAFEKFDTEAGIRKAMVAAMKAEFADLNLTYSIGGQISFDVFPNGWDKTFCLQYVTGFDAIHFFGDKTFEGGNDFEIFVDPRTIGHTVTSPENTIQLCKELFLSN
jgi:phosphomannomutase